MSEKLTALEKSEIESNLASAERDQIESELAKLNFNDKLDKADFENASDFRNGYIYFVADISEESVGMLMATLRRFCRVYPGKALTIEMNCRGGEIGAGLQLYDNLVEMGKDREIIIKVRGAVCSMASVIIQAAHKRLISPSSFVMLHRASFRAGGEAAKVEDAVEEVKMYENVLYGILAKRTGKSITTWKKLLGQRKDVWWTAEQAVEAKLCDKVG